MFRGLQTSSAKLTIDRLIKKVETKDKETMMGIDMFHEERLVLTNKIDFLSYRLNSLEEKFNQEEKTN